MRKMAYGQFILFSFILFINFPVFCQSGIPDLVSPKNNFVTGNNEVNFFWNKVYGASSYNILISTDSAFSFIKTDTNVFFNNVSLSLDSCSKYFWKARSHDGFAFSGWSEYRSLETFNPGCISGLVFHLRADSGIILNNEKIEQWQDLSVNVNHAGQSGPSSRPVIEDSIPQLNNLPVVRFDGTSYLDLISSVSLSASHTFFVIFKDTIKEEAPNSVHQRIIGDYTGSVTLEMGLDNGFFGFSQYLGGWQDRVSAAAVENNKYYLGAYTRNSPGDTFLIRINANPDTGGVIGFDGNNKFNRIGGGYPYSQGSYYGDIAEVIVYNTFFSDTSFMKTEAYLLNKYSPAVDLGGDVIVCDTAYKINAGSRFINYQWSSGDTSSAITVMQEGIYSVTAVDVFGYQSSDSVRVSGFRQVPQLSILNDTINCLGDSVLFEISTNSGDMIQWQDGSSGSQYFAKNAGFIYVNVSDTSGCGFVSDSIYIDVDSFPQAISLGQDISVCAGNFISLTQGQAKAIDYLWSDSSAGSSLVVNTSGTYSVTVTDSNSCIAVDSINVTIAGTAPAVNFSASEVCLGDPTQFMDLSTTSDSIVEWEWDFGDNFIDSTPNPAHLYSSADTFIVSLAATTDAGCSNTKSDTVIVHSLPAANFNLADQVFCSRESISFNDASINSEGTITGWLWNFDDPASGADNISTLQFPLHAFSDSGTFEVSLAVENSFGCADTFKGNIGVFPKPLADFNSLPGCEDSATKFFDNSSGIVTQWEWDFGDENNSAETYPENIYDTAGTYMVSLTVATLMGCIDTVYDSVFVYHNPEAYFTTIDFCRGTPIQAIDSSTVTNSAIVLWNWSVQGTSLTSTQQNPYFEFDSSSLNQYLLKLSVTSAQGCSGETLKQINIHDSPVADFSFSSPYGEIPVTVSFTNSSSNSATSYSWNFGNNDTSDLKNPSYTFNDSGEYQVQLIAYTEYGCADMITKKIKVREPVLDIAVTKVRTDNYNKYMTVSADLYNVGNVPINSFEIIAELSNRPAVKESWSGLLDEKKDTIYTFNASFETSENTMPDAVCVRVENPNSGTDADTTDNEICISFSDFKILSIYPNPASKEIFIEYTLTGEADFQEIIIYDEIGKKVKEFRLEDGKKGYHKVSLDVSAFGNGVYALKIVYAGSYEVKRFIKY